MTDVHQADEPLTVSDDPEGPRLVVDDHDVTDKVPGFALRCPACGSSDATLDLERGWEGRLTIAVICRACGVYTEVLDTDG